MIKGILEVIPIVEEPDAVAICWLESEALEATVIPLRAEDWPTLRDTIDKVFPPPDPSKDAALHRAMRKT